MKKNLFFYLTFLVIFITQLTLAQNSKKVNPNRFDEEAAYKHAKAEGLHLGEIEGYVQFLKNEFSSKKENS